MSWSENGSRPLQMRFAFQGCCFRVEIEVFAPARGVDRQALSPRHGRFQIERQLRRRLASTLGKTRLPGPNVDS
jgi:hypothetical protein